MAWRGTVKRNTDIRAVVKLQLTAGGRTWYFANTNCDIHVRTTDTWTKIKSGLISEVNYSQTISIWQRSADIQELQVEIADQDLLDKIKADPFLTSASAEVSFNAPGVLDWEDRYVILRGAVRLPEWGGPDETITLTISPRILSEKVNFPPLAIDDIKWPNAPTKESGVSYPILLGPTVESLCPYVDNINFKYLIAGHDCHAVPTKIQLVNYDNISRQEVFSAQCYAGDFDLTTNGAGTWAYSGGELKFSHTADAIGYAWLIDSSSNHIKNYNQINKVSAMFITPQADTFTQLGFFFRYTDSNNYYYAVVRRTPAASTIYIGRVVGGVSTSLATVAITQIALDTYFDFTVRVDGNKIVVFLNSQEVAAAEDSAFPKSGDTCFYVYHKTAGTAASAKCDWVKSPVTKPTFSLSADGEGNPVYLADFSDDLGEDTEVYCDVEGMEDVAGNLIEDFGQALIKIVDLYSGLPADDIDDPGWASAGSQISAWKCSSIFNGQSTIPETVAQRLTQQLPIIPLWSRGGYSAVVINYDRLDVQEYLRYPGNLMQRLTKVSNSPVEDIGNYFVVKYGYSPIENRFLKQVIRNRDNNARCALSQAKFGLRSYQPIESYDIQDDATANLLVDYLVRHYSWPQLLVSYLGARDVLWIPPNGIVIVNDAEVGFVDVKFIVETATPQETGVTLALRSI